MPAIEPSLYWQYKHLLCWATKGLEVSCFCCLPATSIPPRTNQSPLLGCEPSNYPWGRHLSTVAPKGALFVESCASPLSLHRRLRQSMGACQRPANFSNQLISPCLVTQCCWRHSPLPFHKQHHTGVAGTTVVGGGRISSPPWGKMGPLSERRGWLMSRNLFETV